MSRFSPCPIRNFETVDRAIFVPLHLNLKTKLLKPQLFSHAFSKGCSIQRDSIATTREVVAFVTSMLKRNEKWTWYGMVSSRASTLRDINVADSRALCLYDTAEANNAAHGEFGISNMVTAVEDEPELRKHILDAFGGGKIIPPKEYRGGAVWDGLPELLRERKP